MKRIPLLLLLTSLTAAAEPDWKQLDAYALDLLQRYLRIDTSNPPGGTRAAAEFLKSELAKNGITARILPSGPNDRANLLLRIPGRDRAKKPLLLMNHMDVVPVDRKAWSVDPFGGIVKDGWIWGRGAVDMKGIGVEQMVALIALKKAGITPARDIVMLSTCDEETGGTYGVRWMIEHHFNEIDAAYVIDEGGVVSRDALAPGRLAAGIAVGEKQVVWVRLRARGTAAHGSQPIPDNANNILLRAVERASELRQPERQNPVVTAMLKTLGTLAPNKFTAALQKNTATLTTLRSGVGDPPKANVIPSTAEATIDFRLLPGVNAEEFLSEMRARINEPRVTLERLSDPADPGASDYNTPLFAALREALRKQHPGAAVTPMLIPYGTDSVYLRRRGLVAYGLNPMALDSAVLATMHSDEERAPVEQFFKGIRVFYDMLRSEF
ncbi:MAG: M20/M25/M40 family metallo-hydrolase [Acidobacteria bacterium]|nr:M20/M25/M40 family metallo-hydrolase [Acidobacteriota bacterium]